MRRDNRRRLRLFHIEIIFCAVAKSKRNAALRPKDKAASPGAWIRSVPRRADTTTNAFAAAKYGDPNFQTGYYKIRAVKRRKRRLTALSLSFA